MSRKIQSIDVFIVHQGLPKDLASDSVFELESIFNRGTLVYPGPEVRCQLTDVHQCRFKAKNPADTKEVIAFLTALEAQDREWVQVNHIYE